ncbi:MAG: zinc finger CCCH domain-containing protein, partial [Alteromonas sp.]|nr:zinc finger CCCH domain-containing protein [Alteromonas sp.]
MLKLYEYFGVQEAEDKAINIESLITLQLQGGDLRGFLNQWDMILANFYPPPEATLLETLFRTQLRKVAGLNEDLAFYERLPAQHPQRCYEFLLDAARRYVNRKRGGNNKTLLMQQLRGQEVAVQAAAVKARAKGVCYFYPKGQCTAGDACRWSHDLAAAQALPAKASPKVKAAEPKAATEKYGVPPLVPPPAKAEPKDGGNTSVSWKAKFADNAKA